MQKVTGVDLLRDLSSFFHALSGMIDGFTERARRVGALLEDPATTFLIVTAPRHDPVEEAIFFHRKLREAGMPFGGLVVNRVHQPPDDTLPEPVAAGSVKSPDTDSDGVFSAGGCSSVGRVPDCDSGCRGFESRQPPHRFSSLAWHPPIRDRRANTRPVFTSFLVFTS